jgi:hypothetical protein
MIAAREVGAADAAAKQHVADLGQRGGPVEEHQMPRRVTGAVQHLQLRCSPTLTSSPAASQRSGSKAGCGGKPNICACCGSAASQKASSRCGPMMGSCRLAAKLRRRRRRGRDGRG